LYITKGTNEVDSMGRSWRKDYSCFMLCGQGRNGARSSVARPEGELGEQC
jgi:hypothetical protein